MVKLIIIHNIDVPFTITVAGKSNPAIRRPVWTAIQSRMVGQIPLIAPIRVHHIYLLILHVMRPPIDNPASIRRPDRESLRDKLECQSLQIASVAVHGINIWIAVMALLKNNFATRWGDKF
ncbi:MAG: hypothetical protein MJE68_15355 [Proteobacteria bacterium]|nr:hypothetical protein [Pseudomonadota bacterium]